MAQAQDGNRGWIIGLTIFGVFALLIVFSMVAKATKPGDITSTTTTKGGFGDILSGIVSNAGGWFGNLIKGSKAFSPSDCDPNKPGYTKSGKKDTRCQIVTGPQAGCDYDKCSSQKGINDCGFIDDRCD